MSEEFRNWITMTLPKHKLAYPFIKMTLIWVGVRLAENFLKYFKLPTQTLISFVFWNCLLSCTVESFHQNKTAQESWFKYFPTSKLLSTSTFDVTIAKVILILTELIIQWNTKLVHKWNESKLKFSETHS